MQNRSDYEIDERAASARALLNDPIVAEALTDLHNRYMENLVGSEVGSTEAAAAHAGLKVLRDFKASLEAMVTDKKMRDHTHRRT